MASRHRHIRRAARLIEWRVDADIDFEVGDLMFYASQTAAHAAAEYVYPMADFIWDTDEATTRRNAIPYFIGVAAERRRGKEDADSVMVVPSGCVFEMPMVSGTPLVGTLLGFVDNAGATALESAKLTIVTNIQDAVGYCVKRYTAATTLVECVLFSSFDPPGGLQGQVRSQWFEVNTALWTTAAGDVLVGYTFGFYARILSLMSVEAVAATGNTVFTLEKNTVDLTDTHTATATGVGKFLRTAITTAGEGYFVHDDVLDIESGAEASGGSGAVGIEYITMPVLET